MGSEADDARNKALTLYRILAVIQLLLGVGLLVCGGLGTEYEEDSFGIPFFVGGFIVGAMMLLCGLLCVFVIYKSSGVTTDVQRRELACAIMGQYVCTMFSLMACFVGMIFAGIGSCDSDFNDECSPERRTIRYALIGGTVAAILTTIFSLYVVCVYGKYFGVVMTTSHRGRMVMSIDPAYGPQTTNTWPNTGTHTARNDHRLQQLQRENELLQRQLELQRQSNQPPPPYAGGYPPSEPAVYGYGQNPAFPTSTSFAQPTAPPPSYSSLK